MIDDKTLRKYKSQSFHDYKKRYDITKIKRKVKTYDIKW